MYRTQRTANMLTWSQSSALAIFLGFYASIFGVQSVRAPLSIMLKYFYQTATITNEEINNVSAGVTCLIARKKTEIHSQNGSLTVEVRLSGGRNSSEGIVQIRSSEETQWRLVCGNNEGWNVKIAICKHQGYVTVDKNHLWTVTGNVSSELKSSLAVCDIQCNDDAELIEHCNISWKENGTDCKCERGLPMGVTCIMSKGTSLKKGPDIYLFIGMGVGIAVFTIFSFLVLILGTRQRKSPVRKNERTANPSNLATLHVEGSPISSNAYLWTEQKTFDISDVATEVDPGDPNSNTDHKLETFTPEDVQNVSADHSGGEDLRVDSVQDETSTQDYFSSAYDMLGPPNADKGQQSASSNATINNDQHFGRSGDQYDLYETVDMRKESTINTRYASVDNSKVANTENIDDLYATVDKSKKAAGRSLTVAKDDVNESTESENAPTKTENVNEDIGDLYATVDKSTKSYKK